MPRIAWALVSSDTTLLVASTCSLNIIVFSRFLAQKTPREPQSCTHHGQGTSCHYCRQVSPSCGTEFPLPLHSRRGATSSEQCLPLARHGARLDAADKQWHLSSPAPYDPPLTYGGWSQSRALGLRIASILRSRETDDVDPAETDGVDGVGGEHRTGDRRRRRHRIIIHSSPFLRCVQTSVAIGSGLSQNPGHSNLRTLSARSSRSSTPVPSKSTGTVGSAGSTASPLLKAHIEARGNTRDGTRDDRTIKKCTLRVDACFGEWMSPEYFELITPPPSSVMMVAGAKADLLRREDYNNLLVQPRDVAAASVQGFPGGWGSPTSTSTVGHDADISERPLSDASNPAHALHRRDRTSSLSIAGDSSSYHTVRPSSRGRHREHALYQPPVPTHAVSHYEPIPSGYVAHARDSCVNVDYQWDSMREPHNWGNGGEFGEEWGSMHKRFRKGLFNLVNWYRGNDDMGRIQSKAPNQSEEATNVGSPHNDDEEDLVVIIVSHGAGCNALIGALTNQPVLIDVGMASLTMAVHKPLNPAQSSSNPPTTRKHSRTPSRSLNVADEYDVKLIANTEHLRTSSAKSTPVWRHNSVSGASGGSMYRSRFGDSPRLDGINTSNRSHIPASFGSIRRTASVATPPAAGTLKSLHRANSVGLWTPPTPEPIANAGEEPGDDMVLNFGDDEKPPTPQPDNKEKRVAFIEEHPQEADEDRQIEDMEAEFSKPGLWGTPRPPGEAERNREFAPKRRWTVTQRGA